MKTTTLALIVLASLVVTAVSAAADQPVPVVKERFHQPVFENEYVRMIDVRIPQGVTSAYHVHDVASVVVYLTKSTNRSQTWGETNTTPRHTVPGDSRYVPYDEKPLTHRVTNDGPGDFHVWDIELLRPIPTGAFPAAGSADLKAKWEQKRVRSSNLLLPAFARSTVKATACAHVAIAINDGVAIRVAADRPGDRKIAAGEFVFIAAGRAFDLTNSSREPADVVVLELP